MSERRIYMHHKVGTCAVALGLPLAIEFCYPHHDELPLVAKLSPVTAASATTETSVGVQHDAHLGRLAPEVIQRVVRNGFGLFRRCYENALRRNPDLQGIVKVKFVIDPSGTVAMTADAGSDLPDQGVVKCVVRGFGDLSFPQPDGGMVTVVYPIMFRPGQSPTASDTAGMPVSMQPNPSVPLGNDEVRAERPGAKSSGGSQSLADRYTFEVQVVDRAPSELFLLSRFSEPPGDSCKARLLEHAHGLGANRLFIDRAATCSGSAYFVRPGFPERSPMINASLRDWLRARWRRPPSISAEESAHLCVVVQFSASPLRRVWRVNGQPIRSSGNRAFDDSVLAALDSAIDERATVPAPPRDAVGEYVEYRIEFTEGDPSRCWVER